MKPRLLAAIAVAGALAAATPAGSTGFTVNSIADAPDASPGDGVCDLECD
jgi:hypothetical protein